MNTYDAVLATVNHGMKALGLTYAYGEYRETPAYPYWVGEYSEQYHFPAEHKRAGTFVLTGFSRGDERALLEQAARIRGRLSTATRTFADAAATVSLEGQQAIRRNDGLSVLEIRLSARAFGRS